MSRTQLRLGQITGSFGDFEGGIVDNLPTAATLAAIPAGSGSMVSALSQLASAVQRVHGGTAFSTNAAGVFSHAIKPDSAGGQDIGTTSAEWGDLYIGDSTISIGLGQEHTIADGNTGLLIDSSEKIEINSSGAEISIGNDGVAQAINIGTGAAARTITVGNTTGATTLDINLGTGGLDVDATNGPIALDTTNTGTGITIGTVNSGVPISIGHSTSEVTVNDNLTVTGDLTVNGDTITVNVENMTVEDNIIGLATTGSTAYGPSGNDRGIVFAGGALSAKQPALYYDGSASKFVFATTTTSPSSASFVATPAQGELNTVVASTISFDFAGNETISGDGTDISFAVGAGGDINIPQDIGLTFGADTQKIEANASNDLTIEAGGDIYLDANGADIVFMDGGTTFGKITNSSSDLVLSASIGGQALKLEGSGDGVYVRDLESDMFKVIYNGITQANEIQFATGQSAILKSQGGTDIVLAAESSGNVVLGIDDASGAGYLMLTGSGINATIAVGGLQGEFGSAGGALTVTGSAIEFKAGQSAFESRYYDIGESNYVGFKAPSLTGNQIYTLPATPTNGYFLTTDGSGVLSWATATGATKKGTKIITTLVSSNTDVAFNSVDVGTAPTDFSTAGSQGDTLDVYVNGQLLLSGSNAEITSVPPTRDFEITSTTQLRFAFDLEVDDVVTVINR